MDATAPTYPDHWTMRQARDRYFAANGFSEAGYEVPWIKLPVGPLPLGFPNSRGRIRAVKLHDLHHIVTNYDTSLTGEAEIGAWELGAGCGNFFMAWVLNGTAAAFGLLFAPRRVVRAFRRGRRSRSLYRAEGEFRDELLARTVGEMRAELLAD